MTKKTKKGVQFAVSMREVDGRWIGEVVWIDTGEKQAFRSTLELIKLLDSAIEKNECEDGR